MVPTADGLQPGGYQHERQDQDQNALEDLIQRRRGHAAEHDVEADGDRVDDVEGPWFERRHIAVQFTASLPISQRGERGLLRGGQATSTNAMVGSSVTKEEQGIAYGLGQSASALGGGVGPLIGGALATAIGLQPIFAISAGIFVVSGFLILPFLSFDS